MTATSLSTKPGSYVMATTDIKPLGFDTSDDLAEGQTPSAPVTSMVDEDGAAIVLVDAPTISGNVITQIVRGSVMEADTRYFLTVQFTAGTDDETTSVLRIYCQQ